jgi:hypothetical protein
MEADLAGKVEPLPGWRRLAGLITRLPPVAAALPVLSAVAALPAGGEISWQAVRDAAVALVATALVIWLLVVWPSIRLGFRIKRAIFCGGRDLRHPLWFRLDELQWEGFADAKVYDDAGKLWVELFRMVLGLALYLWFAFSGLAVVGLVQTVARGFAGPTPVWFVLLLAVLIPSLSFQLLLQAVRNYRLRSH